MRLAHHCVRFFVCKRSRASRKTLLDMPERARDKMASSFRSLLKIAEAEGAGRVDMRWKLADVRFDMRVFRKLAAGENGKSLYAWRAVTTIDCPPAVLSNVIMETS